jgi:hypothetical protein
MHITIELPCKVESHQADNDAGKSQYSCGDIDDERPSPWPPSDVDLPFKFESGNEFPPIQGINREDLVGCRVNSHVNPGEHMQNFNKMALPKDTSEGRP